MRFEPAGAPPLLTAELPGIAGRIKQEPADFEVHELPAYTPSGEGEFLYLWIEKQDMGAEYFVRQLARRLEITPAEVGTAGMKDRRAVTRQMVSVPAHVAGRLKNLSGEGLRLLGSDRHGNKLRPGHLLGNRFRILVRDVQPDAITKAAAILDRLRREGVPNFYGPQRFGRRGETVELGLNLLRGGQPRPRSRFLRKLALSAAQSSLFNHYLAHRLADGFLRTVLKGDVMARWPAGGLFVAEDAAAEQVRLESREIVPAGPMFGRKLFPAGDDAAAREQAVLEAAGITTDAFRGYGKLLPGTRRRNLVYVDDLAAAHEPSGLRLTFTLPAGSYATIVLREIMKTPWGAPGEEA